MLLTVRLSTSLMGFLLLNSGISDLEETIVVKQCLVLLPWCDITLSWKASQVEGVVHYPWQAASCLFYSLIVPLCSGNVALMPTFIFVGMWESMLCARFGKGTDLHFTALYPWGCDCNSEIDSSTLKIKGMRMPNRTWDETVESVGRRFWSIVYCDQLWIKQLTL